MKISWLLTDSFRGNTRRELHVIGGKWKVIHGTDDDMEVLKSCPQGSTLFLTFDFPHLGVWMMKEYAKDGDGWRETTRRFEQNPPEEIRFPLGRFLSVGTWVKIAKGSVRPVRRTRDAHMTDDGRIYRIKEDNNLLIVDAFLVLREGIRMEYRAVYTLPVWRVFERERKFLDFLSIQSQA